MNILIIGGTRNIGYFTTETLLADGHRVTLLNRGMTPDPFPEEMARLQANRNDYQQMRRALSGREFDVVIDMVLYNEADAEAIVDLLDGQIGHYIFISTGQVYLVRDGITRPVTEDQYAGALISEPDNITYDHEEWVYGMEKRGAEDALAAAFEKSGFPYTSLRLPMVNSERDVLHQRLYGYVLRIQDGGPILIPDVPNYPLRHIYVKDVVQAIKNLIETGVGKGKAYNISQDETISLKDFLGIVSEYVGKTVNIIEVERTLLETNGLLPDCSPFSDVWMSELDNTLSKTELGMRYTPLRTYLESIVTHYMANPPSKPIGYKRRQAEKNLLMSI